MKEKKSEFAAVLELAESVRASIDLVENRREYEQSTKAALARLETVKAQVAAGKVEYADTVVACQEQVAQARESCAEAVVERERTLEAMRALANEDIVTHNFLRAATEAEHQGRLSGTKHEIDGAKEYLAKVKTEYANLQVLIADFRAKLAPFSK